MSHWSYELNFSRLWVSIMHGLTWSELNYCAWFVLSVSSLPLSVMVSSCHACIVFVPRASRRRCTLAVALHRRNSGLGTKTTRRSWTFSLHEIFKCAHLKFTVYGRKQTDIHTHNFCKCSHASVGLTQDCSNYIFMTCTCMWPVHVYSPTAWNGLIRCPHFHYACVNTCTKST